MYCPESQALFGIFVKSLRQTNSDINFVIFLCIGEDTYSCRCIIKEPIVYIATRQLD